MSDRHSWWITVGAAIATVTAGLVFHATAEAATPDCDTEGFYVAGWPDKTGTLSTPEGWTPVETGGILHIEQDGPYDAGQARGTQNLINAVDTYAATCDGPIRIKGHSYGAAIVSTALPTIATRDYAHRVTVHTTGNPRHPGGIEDRLSGGIMPGITMRGPEQPHTIEHETVCNPGDGICDFNLRGILGYFTGKHVYE